MNRNIVSVLLGGYGTDSTVKGGQAAKQLEGEAQFTDVPNTVELLTNSKKARAADRVLFVCRIEWEWASRRSFLPTTHPQ